MPFQKGNKHGKGRPKGLTNKVTASVKDALTQAFDELGGVPSLVKWGKANPSDFYHLWAKMLPKDLSVKIGGELTLSAEIRKRINEVDSGIGGLSSEVGGDQPGDVADASASSAHQQVPASDVGGAVGSLEH